MSSTVNDVASSNAERDAVRIAERVAEAWHSVDHSGRLDVPMSVVAAIATVSATSAEGQDLTESLTAWITANVVEFARTVWARFLTGRPDLAAPLYPMIAWLYPPPDNHPDPGSNRSHSEEGEEGEPSPELVSRAQTVAIAALGAGQLALSGTQRRLETDLLGITLTGLRPRSALRTRGQFYTPAAAADVLAAMLGLSEHASVSDPAMGTGGMFRAAAAAMRARGMNPATVAWVGTDIDPIAVAAAAVNSAIWGLGPNVLIWTVNTLSADPADSYATALARRNELIDLARWHARNRTLRQFLDLLTTPHQNPEAEPESHSDPGEPAGRDGETDSA